MALLLKTSPHGKRFSSHGATAHGVVQRQDAGRPLGGTKIKMALSLKQRHPQKKYYIDGRSMHE